MDDIVTRLRDVGLDFGDDYWPLFSDAADEIERLRALVDDLTSPDECTLDHHGYCQTHGWLGDTTCPHARAKEARRG